jgi:hypothetical protein
MVKYLNQGRSLSEMFDAVLDLNTGAYSVVSRSLFTGYFRRFPGSGVKVLRDTVLSAKVKLTPQACTASMLKATLKAELQDDEAHPLPICAARFKTDGGKSSFEFIINPRNAVSPRGCIAAHEGPMPQPDMPVAQNAGQAFGASLSGKPR